MLRFHGTFQEFRDFMNDWDIFFWISQGEQYINQQKQATKNTDTKCA